MDYDILVKTLADGYIAYVQLLSWFFPWLKPWAIQGIAIASTIWVQWKLCCWGIDWSTGKEQKSKKIEMFHQNFVGPRYPTPDEMGVANIRAILRNEPIPFNDEIRGQAIKHENQIRLTTQ